MPTPMPRPSGGGHQADQKPHNPPMRPVNPMRHRVRTRRHGRTSTQTIPQLARCAISPVFLSSRHLHRHVDQPPLTRDSSQVSALAVPRSPRPSDRPRPSRGGRPRSRAHRVPQLSRAGRACSCPTCQRRACAHARVSSRPASRRDQVEGRPGRQRRVALRRLSRWQRAMSGAGRVRRRGYRGSDGRS